MSYADELLKKKYKANIIIKFLDVYFGARQPDSGLTILPENLGIINSLTINPTQVDLKQANTTIASYNFSILDKDLVLTKLAAGRGAIFFNTDIEIWIGRTTGNFPFSQYLKLPVTRVKSVSRTKNSYKFSSVEATQKIIRPIFSVTENLFLSINDLATVVTATTDISSFPSSGMIRIDDEFISYSSKNNATKQLSGCVRGLLDSVAADHDSGAEIDSILVIQDNPINILLKLLISKGGGGTYDVLDDGAGIDASLIDISGIEAIRDADFPDDEFLFYINSIDNALEFIEKEILLACNLRFSNSVDSKITLVLLDQAAFGEEISTINNDSISSEPTWSVTENSIVNRIYISWDYDDLDGHYRRRSMFFSQDSIDEFGERPSLNFTFKGIKEDLDGENIVNNRGARLLERFSTPQPEISFKTHIDKSLLDVGAKVLIESNEIPSIDGTLNFLQEMEIISRSINHENGEVNFKIAFTSYSAIRGAYISPSDIVETVISQKKITVSSGRGAMYEVGWVMVLAGIDDTENTIAEIDGDDITFENDFIPTLAAGTDRIRFADYDKVVANQRRYAFISDGGNDFDDGSSTYRITF